MSASLDSAVWRRDPALPFQRLEEETIVVDPRTRAVHLFNETGARIWELLAAPCTLDELFAVLSEEYDAPEAELREELTAFVTGLRERGLLTTPGGPSRSAT